MAYSVLHEMKEEPEYMNDPIVEILYTAYKNLITILYSKSYDKIEVYDILEKSIKEGCPLNIRTNDYDHTVLSSIKSDIIVLETISKILTLMYTTNQYLVPTPAHNIYEKEYYINANKDK
jgi:hypothetical protein